MLLSEFDYELPKHLVAAFPVAERDHSRLMVLDRGREEVECCRFFDIGKFLKEDDLLVLNDTRVIPSRIMGVRPTGAKVEALLLEEREEGRWEGLLNARGRVKEGDRISFESGALHAKVRRLGGGLWEFSFEEKGVFRLLEACGRAPVPPYIHHWRDRDSFREMDRDRYQTVYAQKEGAVAAPTAGLHFTWGLLKSLEAKGIRVTCVTLHVGWGTFQVIREESVESHKMHREYFHLSPSAVEAVETARSKGGRVVAVGTTSVRVLESAAKNRILVPSEGWTDLYIYPGFQFQAVDAMITNFHLPKSSLLILVCAFGGRERILRTYKKAIAEKFRFYSYGDAMLIL